MGQSKAVLVTGGTGNIGSAVVAELITHGHSVSVLCRSEQSENRARAMGAEVVVGNIEEPLSWLEALDQFDALIHTACGFGDDMGAIDKQLMNKIAQKSEKRKSPLTFLYTSGCWNFGSSEKAISEQTPKDTLPEFRWMLDSIEFLQNRSGIDLRVVSPVNVVSKDEQCVPPILLWELDRCGQPCIPSTEQLCWSLVERENLAELYRLVLEKGKRGEEYIGAGDSSVNVAELAQRLSPLPVKKVPIKEWQELYGNWAGGYGLRQPFTSEKATTELGWLSRSVFNN